MLSINKTYKVFSLSKDVIDTNSFTGLKEISSESHVFYTEEEACEYLKEIEHRGIEFVVLPVMTVVNNLH